MIKNIIFDMGGVLVDWSPEMYLGKYGLSQDEILLLKEKIFSSYHWPLLDFGYYRTEEEYLAAVLPDIPEYLHPVARDVACHWDKDGVPEYEGMGEIIRQLKEQGLGIYLLSNAGPRHDQYWATCSFSKYFDGKVVSAYENQFKPASDIYRTILDRFSLKADECIFIDDVSVNCAGAKIVGINPILFINPDRLKEDFRKFGIEVK